MSKLAFFLGKGGVGKTTVSSSVAYHLAAFSKKKVLIVSLDPAHNLGDVFHTELGDEVREVRENLDAMEIDLEAWVKRYLEQSRKEIEDSYRYNAVFNFDSYLDIMKYSPGTEEYAVLWAIEYVWETYSESYDVIIFDTPPTALTLRFLAMPSISELWIKELTGLRKAILEKRQTVLKLNPEANVIGGSVKKEDDPLYTRLGSIHKRLSVLKDLFCDKSYISVVLNPDDLSFDESLRIRKELGKLSVTIASLCYNKVVVVDAREQRLRTTFAGVPVFSFPRIDEGILTIDDLARVDTTLLVEHLLKNAR